MSSVEPDKIRSGIRDGAPSLWKAFEGLAGTWLAPALERLDERRPHASYPKTFNDPVWGVIELMPWETILLDTPLLQRLRGVRQLGMAHFVYPGAGHDRLEHARGVVEAAERMIRALERNAGFRRRFGSDRDEHVPEVSEMDLCATRLAALLHDIGHGPFSHATEELIKAHHAQEFTAAETILRDHFEGVGSIAPAELIAVIIVLSKPMSDVLTHPGFGTGVDRPAKLPETIVARILGSRSCLDAGYLSGIISGPVDADKLDYIARDCHHSGLSFGIDLTRLISKLEVVAVTPQNAPNSDLRKRAQAAGHQRFYDIGISQTGLGSYEQLVITRVLLFDRLYYHQKVRTAEGMVRRLIGLAEEECGTEFAIEKFFAGFSDDIFIGLVGGTFRANGFLGGDARSRALARMLHDRNVYYRAFAFAARFIAGISDLPDQEQQDTRAKLWRKPLKELSSLDGCRDMATKIFGKARRLADSIPDLAAGGRGLQPEHVLVDLPLNKVVVRGGDILTRTDGGHIGTPNLFFDPERWSQAYEHQKQCGFVFTPRRHVPLVALASRIVFYESFGIVMDIQAERAAKVSNAVRDEWFEKARKAGLCDEKCAGALTASRQSRLVMFDERDPIGLPAEWLKLDPDIKRRLIRELGASLPSGLVASFHEAVLSTIGDLASFVQMAERTGAFATKDRLPEKDLQKMVRQHLESREVNVVEGAKVGGGETDLVLRDRTVIENKVLAKRSEPFKNPGNASWQARRYAMPLCSNVTFVIVAYRPRDEASLLPPPERVRVLSIPDAPEERCEVRFAVPWGTGVPSSARGGLS